MNTMLHDPWAEDVSILSSENVAFGVETAGLGSRLAAATIDFTLQAVTFGLLGIASLIVLNYLPPMDSWAQWISGGVRALMWLAGFVIFLGYYFVFEWLWDGQTPGKRWLGLRVLQIDGMPLTPWGALVRNLIRIADFLPIGYGAGALIAVMNPNNRRAGDLIAGTIVARERHDASKSVLSIGDAVDAFLAQSQAPTAAPQTSKQVAAGVTPLVHPLEAQTSVPTTAPAISSALDGDELERNRVARLLNDQDRELLRDFLRRRASLTPAARNRLAHALAVNLAHKIEATPPPAAEAEAALDRLAMLALPERH